MSTDVRSHKHKVYHLQARSSAVVRAALIYLPRLSAMQFCCCLVTRAVVFFIVHPLSDCNFISICRGNEISPKPAVMSRHSSQRKICSSLKGKHSRLQERPDKLKERTMHDVHQTRSWSVCRVILRKVRCDFDTQSCIFNMIKHCCIWMITEPQRGEELNIFPLKSTPHCCRMGSTCFFVFFKKKKSN